MTAVAATPPSLFGSGLVARRVDGADMRTVAGVLTALADAWEFPDHFGHNRDALDDCMRDLPASLRTSEGTPSTGWLTIALNASQILADEPDELAWFAESIDFWRSETRGRRFAVLLVDADPAAVRTRWASVGAPLTDTAEEI